MSWGSEVAEEWIAEAFAKALGLPSGQHAISDLLAKVRQQRKDLMGAKDRLEELEGGPHK